MIIELDLCRPDINNPDKDMKMQLDHIGDEVYEAKYALEKFKETKKNKDRAELLFELLDIINSAQTAISMEFKDDEVQAGCQYINAKNYVRHYLKKEHDNGVEENT